MGKLGGLGVINLEGVQTRYENPAEVLSQVVKANSGEVTTLIQKLYLEPIKEELIGRRVQELKKAGVLAAVSSIPQKAERFGAIAQEAGADVFVVQSTVSTVRHISTQYKSLELAAFCQSMRIPVIIGNAVTYNVTLELMGCGVAGVLVGVGPGAACTSRGVLGLRRAASHRHGRLRSGPRLFFQNDEAVCPDHHRWWHEQRRRRLQSARVRLRRSDGRQRLRPRRRSARPGKPLGHGDTTREPAARDTNQSRRERLVAPNSFRTGDRG
jgi:hypothetical protein